MGKLAVTFRFFLESLTVNNCLIYWLDTKTGNRIFKNGDVL